MSHWRDMKGQVQPTSFYCSHWTLGLSYTDRVNFTNQIRPNKTNHLGQLSLIPRRETLCSWFPWNFTQLRKSTCTMFYSAGCLHWTSNGKVTHFAINGNPLTIHQKPTIGLCFWKLTEQMGNQYHSKSNADSPGSFPPCPVKLTKSV